jgi:hypothetical protein
VAWYLHGDATLRFPIGYRNANAAFFLVGFWSLLALGTEARWRWPLRAVVIASATLLFELAFLAQSRGSVPATVLAGLVFVALSRNRLRVAAILALTVLPVIPAVPTLLDVYRHADADPGVVSSLHDAARAVWLTSALSFLLSAFALGGVAPRLRLGQRTTAAIGRTSAALVVVVIVVGGSIFVARHGGPIGFVDQRIKEFNRVGYPDLHGQGIRYGANVGSNRHDFWRVAMREGLAHPLLGGGGGSFQVAYLEHRRSPESPKDPHSVEALMFGELGFPGLLLLVTFVGAVVAAGLRTRHLGPAAAALVAGGLAAGAQWLTQASVDWLWNYPGITAPAIFLAGAVVAPPLLDFNAPRGRTVRVLGITVLVALALAIVPLFLSVRYAQRASEEASRYPHAALADFDRAARFNPLDASPLLSKGSLEARLGEKPQALEAFRQAANREPDNYAAYYFLASELATTNPSAAESQLGRALELNPHDASLHQLQRRLENLRAR